MAKTTRKATVRKSAAADDERKSAPADVTPKPLKAVAPEEDPLDLEDEVEAEEQKPEVEVQAPPPAPPRKPLVRYAELLEAATYTVQSVTFVKKRPVPVSNPHLFELLRNNSSFRCWTVGG